MIDVEFTLAEYHRLHGRQRPLSFAELDRLEALVTILRAAGHLPPVEEEHEFRRQAILKPARHCERCSVELSKKSNSRRCKRCAGFLREYGRRVARFAA